MTRRAALLLAARILVSAVLIALVLTHVDISQSLRLLARSHLALVIIGLAFGVVGVVISAMQWGVLLSSDGVQLSRGRLVALYFFGYAFNVLLPTTIGGDAVKAAAVARESGRPGSAIAATLMARVVGFGVLLLTALPVSLVASLVWASFGWGPTAILVAAGAGFVLFLVMLRAGDRLPAVPALMRTRWGGAVGRGMRRIAGFTGRWSVLFRAALLSLLFYPTLYLNYFGFGAALGLRAPFWFYWVAVPILSIVTLIPVSLNGYGLREATAIALFRLTSDPPSSALSLALLVELQLLLFALMGAGLQPAIGLSTRNGVKGNHERS